VLDNINSAIFNDSDSIGLVPVVSAEWNHNLFNPPYVTIAGDITAMSLTSPSSTGTLASATTGESKPNFTTKKFTMSSGQGFLQYSVTANGGKAYKIITYVKTNNSMPIMATAFAEGTSSQYGSTQEEVSSLGWTKITTYIGTSQASGDTISSFTYRVNFNVLSGITDNPIVYFTVPEVYKTSYEDYKYGSFWPTDSVFSYFRPGESYVPSGNINCLFPSNYRKITSPTITGYTSAVYSPISSITQMPSFFLASSPVPALKSALPTDISAYKYFVSDGTSNMITAKYEKGILTNKIIVKFNTLVTIPSIKIKVNNSFISVDGSETISMPANADSFTTGLLTLYYTGSEWTKTKWSSMPSFTSSGSISQTMSLTSLSVSQISKTTRSEFSSYDNANLTSDLVKMQLVEVSPRLEVDLSSFVENISIDKSLDGQNNLLPISSMNTNSCNITLSAIPLLYNNEIVNVFSSQSDSASTLLSSILRKNIKFYVNFNLFEYSDLSTNTVTSTTAYVPAGVFYSDSWDESDIDTVSIQSFDISRYLQSTPVPDYVVNLKNVFDVITNILDLAGFTDYDYDSLYNVCNNKANPMDLAYFYCNSKDSTIVDTLNKIFVAYQIGAYIDEYGIMKFLSLHNILSSSTSNLTVSDFNIKQGGFSISNKAKPGKISLRYQIPKVKQSPSLQNVTNPMVKNSPSFVYATSNDVVWQQQSIDSVGFNYINSNMEKNSNMFNINVNDLQDIFHTFNRDASGYAFIENEIVSFLYKEYEIGKFGESPITVSIKNDTELQSEINNFIKQNNVGLKTSYATVTNVARSGSAVVYTAANTFKVGQKVIVTAVNPKTYNINGIISSRTNTSFSIIDPAAGTYVSGGEATVPFDYEVIVTPTGNITNVQRGLYGTVPAAHTRITTLASKSLSEKRFNDSTLALATSSGYTSIIDDNDNESTLPSISKINVSETIYDIGINNKLLIYPTTETDIGYHTYSVKFDMPDQSVASAGLFFNMASTTSSAEAYFIELVRYNQENPKSPGDLYDPPKYKYVLLAKNVTTGVMFWSEVTGECNSIVNNFSKIIKKTLVGKEYEYSYVTDNPFNLKVAITSSDGSDGESGTVGNNKIILSIFLNNVEIVGWQESKTDDYDVTTNPGGSGWKSTEVNGLTGMRQKPYFDDDIQTGTKFGFHASMYPTMVPDLHPEPEYFDQGTRVSPAALREIHATEKALTERSVSYFYQDREFLNGLVQGQPLYSNSITYLMQTSPEVAGINYYDVQYTTPAAVSVDVLPVEYMWYYFPGNEKEDQTNYQKKLIDEYSLSYSTPINTGFRAKMVIANNSSNMVFLHKEADDLDQFTINLNLWTHEIVAPSDPEILEVLIDQSNSSKVAQLDSEWIQSKQAAQRMLKLVQMGIEGFSKDANLSIFGNPLIQVGDIITLTYSLNGISQQKYFVHSVSHSFNQGLETRLGLKRIQ
jgi:intracellular sulfur oxidation DsrE/DsrF family protein